MSQREIDFDVDEDAKVLCEVVGTIVLDRLYHEGDGPVYVTGRAINSWKKHMGGLCHPSLRVYTPEEQAKVEGVVAESAAAKRAEKQREQDALREASDTVAKTEAEKRNDEIREAAQFLNHQTDEHWLDSGKPDLSELSAQLLKLQYAGNPTRAEVNEALGTDFKRITD
jgi:hypothetical protein